MRFAVVVLLAILLAGCVDNEDRNVLNVSITLPPTISYNQAIKACNLTNPTGITLSNQSGRWVWELTFENGTTTIFCRVDEKGELSVTKLPGTLHSDPIPLSRIRIDEYAAFNIAIENEEVAKWINTHNARSTEYLWKVHRKLLCGESTYPPKTRS